MANIDPEAVWVMQGWMFLDKPLLAINPDESIV